MPLSKDGKEYLGAFVYFFPGDVSVYDTSWRKFYEVYPSMRPPSPFSYNDIKWHTGEQSRSLELWKEPDDELIRLIFTGPEAPKEADADFEQIKETEPSFVKSAAKLMEQGYHAYFFDVEQSHGLPGCAFDLKQERVLMERLIRALEGKGAWVQFVWSDYPHAELLEYASMSMQSVVEEIEKGMEVVVSGNSPTEILGAIFHQSAPMPRLEKKTVPHPWRGSTIHIHGKSIAKEYFQKSQHHVVLLSVRGFILTKTDLGTLNSVFANVKISYDALKVYTYGDARMLRWLRARLIPDPTAFLEAHAQGGYLYEWGFGRELIPALLLTPEELPVMVHLPSDPDLPLKFARGGLLPSGLQSEKEGPELWKQE